MKYIKKFEGIGAWGIPIPIVPIITNPNRGIRGGYNRKNDPKNIGDYVFCYILDKRLLDLNNFLTSTIGEIVDESKNGYIIEYKDVPENLQHYFDKKTSKSLIRRRTKITFTREFSDSDIRYWNSEKDWVERFVDKYQMYKDENDY